MPVCSKPFRWAVGNKTSQPCEALSNKDGDERLWVIVWRKCSSTFEIVDWCGGSAQVLLRLLADRAEVPRYF